VFAVFLPAVRILVCCISGIDLLQDIPLDTAITETTDHGKPIVIALPNSSQVKKINFSQAEVVPLPAMRAQGGVEGLAPLILNLGTRWR
jgi:hypothetical protein